MFCKLDESSPAAARKDCILSSLARKAAGLLALALWALTLLAADWRQFRGNDSSGVALTDSLPEQVDKSIAWKVDLPGRGASSPIIVGDRIFLTASSGLRQDRLHVLAHDAKTGHKVWERNIWATGPTTCHPKTCMATPTPTSDGKKIVALFSTNDLLCLDLDGNVLWMRSLHEENPGATDGRGLASSPVLVGDTIVLHIENQNTSFAAGIDVNTGAHRWRDDRPRELCWSSPIALPGDVVLLQGMKDLSALEVRTGSEAWRLQRESDAIASSVLAGNLLYVPGEKGLAAFALQGAAPPKSLWEVPKVNPTTASPLVLKDRIYSLRGSMLVSADIKNGEVRGQLRLKGPFSSSPVAAGG
jgi:outer membrane protein assembly factor BamB